MEFTQYDLAKMLLGSVLYNDTDAVIVMLLAGASPHCMDTDGRTALMHAVHNGNLRMVSALIDAGAYVNKTDKHGMTALMFASHMGRVDIVRTMLKAGARLDITDQWGRTALIIAQHALYGLAYAIATETM